jgi:hypothetical protein
MKANKRAVEQYTTFDKRRVHESVHYERTLLYIPKWVIPYTDEFSMLRTDRFDIVETYLPERDYSWSRMFTSSEYLHTDIIADPASEELIKMMQIKDTKTFLMERLRGCVYICEHVWFGFYFIHSETQMSIFPVYHMEESVDDCIERTRRIMPESYLLFHGIQPIPKNI